jgi:hypothetical protein
MEHNRNDEQGSRVEETEMRDRVNLRPHRDERPCQSKAPFFLGEQEGVSWAFIANKQKGSQTRKKRLGGILFSKCFNF